ncbi:MAG: hypothetical protein ABFQ53_02985 [Patescibacteria group bacterium]
MKKLIIIVFFALFPMSVFALWDDCHKGVTDSSCEEPGRCGRYIDTNSDHICDHSQPAPITKTTITPKSVPEPQIEDEIVAEEKVPAQATVVEKSNDVVDATKQDYNKVEKEVYPLFITFVLTGLLYGVTYLLAKNKTITVLTHRKIWNSVLTVSFFATAGLSIILIIRINSGQALALPFDALYWHVVTGIVMMTVSMFHIGWHWKYYKNLFRK